MNMKQPRQLANHCLRLRPDAGIEELAIDETFWPRLMAGQLGDFHNEYLVSLYEFSENWPSSEIHPLGDEVVILLEGAAVFQLELKEGMHAVELSQPGAYVFVPKGTWHTAKIQQHAKMLFITAGEDTQHRPHSDSP
ncbi:cupin domain-containing protein [Photobacterium sp. 1_MG-2023]|uniref:cupin domain-containing protein n=1 Tax=Photobacterium sp. 1_MG-2023 TaxID=3062646 RepID=UPI0026E1B428|nr:cupin domain-containing protein [Photobacterium sp. 1_MG-2023]MDO6708166.1 cupin domain-containing protein [Photobacterium sp. 1_MG-2023]